MTSNAGPVAGSDEQSLTLLARQLDQRSAIDAYRQGPPQAGDTSPPLDRFTRGSADPTQLQQDNLMKAMRSLADRFDTHQALRTQAPGSSDSPDADPVTAGQVASASQTAAAASTAAPPAVPATPAAGPDAPAVAPAPSSAGSGDATSADTPGSGGSPGSGSRSTR